MNGVKAPRRGGASKLSSDQSLRCFIGPTPKAQANHQEAIGRRADKLSRYSAFGPRLMYTTYIPLYLGVTSSYICMEALSCRVEIINQSSRQLIKILGPQPAPQYKNSVKKAI